MQKRKLNALKANISVGLVVVVLILIFVTAKFSGRVIPNTEGAVGNSACNLYNGGLFCSDDEKIYFSNLKDRGALYSMSKELTDFEYMQEDTAGYINNTSNYIVYSRLNYTRNDTVKRVLQFSYSGIYRVAKKGSHAIGGIYAYDVGAVGLIGNKVYYQRHEKDGNMNLYCSSLDGKNEELLLEEKVVPGTLTSSKIYYGGAEGDHYIYSFDPVTKQKVVIYKGNCYQPALIGGNIYFISLSKNYNIAKIDEYGQNPTILVEEKCSFYNVTPNEQYVVYQVDDAKNNRLEMMNLSTLEKTVIKTGDYNSINIIGDRVFFREFGTDEVYYFSLSSPGQVENFNPPDLSKDK
ncbi:hypothetical protein GCWU000282_02814 [Catonella morbi ATCC 51271]|uniref:Prolow-density lipoprotein receptor-related protein 1-like beta-propeller domain-containing protein n=1 Tax=Catonella morbi ATCC 51271 TaxID=592026 RepID=V2Z4Z8_9FIRM|nr:DUF5050 domain-containing protein [Catonella morbi]ESL01995.1 hypothetical protein GCWU000282_02814 [Catonella morbi ATCC 51271]